jgi:hypothetical protein
MHKFFRSAVSPSILVGRTISCSQPARFRTSTAPDGLVCHDSVFLIQTTGSNALDVKLLEPHHFLFDPMKRAIPPLLWCDGIRLRSISTNFDL